MSNMCIIDEPNTIWFVCNELLWILGKSESKWSFKGAPRVKMQIIQSAQQWRASLAWQLICYCVGIDDGCQTRDGSILSATWKVHNPHIISDDDSINVRGDGYRWQPSAMTGWPSAPIWMFLGHRFGFSSYFWWQWLFIVVLMIFVSWVLMFRIVWKNWENYWVVWHVLSRVDG